MIRFLDLLKVTAKQKGLTSTTFLKVWTIGYVGLLIVYFVHALLYANFEMDGAFADLFINYQGGFVRRGLLGELLYQMSLLGVNPVIVAVLFLVVSFAVVAIYLIRAFYNRGYNLCLLPVCFLLGGFSLYDFTFYRRDFFMLCVFLLTVYLWRKMSYKKWLLAANLLTIFAILCYEPYAFWGIPFLLILTNLRLRHLWQTVLAWTPAVFAFLLCCFYSGNQHVFDAVWSSVDVFVKNPSMIHFLARNTMEVLLFHLTANFCTLYHGVPIVLINLFCISCMIYYVLYAVPVYSEKSGVDRRQRTYLLSLLLYVMFFLMPMFVALSTDYGRTCTCAVISSFMMFFALKDEEKKRMLPTCIFKKLDSFLELLERKCRPTRMKILFIILFVGVISWTGASDVVRRSEFGGVIHMIINLVKK